MTPSPCSAHALGRGSPKPNAQVTGHLNAFETVVLSKGCRVVALHVPLVVWVDGTCVLGAELKASRRRSPVF